MFNFIRGDRDNLKGKASLYIEDYISDKNGNRIEFPVIYVAHSFMDIKLPGESFLSEEDMKQTDSELKKAMELKHTC